MYIHEQRVVWESALQKQKLLGLCVTAALLGQPTMTVSEDSPDTI